MSFRVRATFAAALFVMLAISRCPPRQPRSQWTPPTTLSILPSGPDGLCKTAANVLTPRAAIMEANAAPSADTIVLPAGNYFMSLTAIEDGGISGDYDITTTAVISGAGRNATFIYGLRYTANDNRVSMFVPGPASPLARIDHRQRACHRRRGRLRRRHPQPGHARAVRCRDQRQRRRCLRRRPVQPRGIVSGSSVSVTVNTAQLSGAVSASPLERSASLELSFITARLSRARAAGLCFHGSD